MIHFELYIAGNIVLSAAQDLRFITYYGDKQNASLFLLNKSKKAFFL